MRKTRWLLALLAITLWVPATLAQEETGKKERKGEDTTATSRHDRLRELQDAMRKLQEEGRRLRAQLQELERSLREEPGERPLTRERRWRERLPMVVPRFRDFEIPFGEFDRLLPRLRMRIPQLDLEFPGLSGAGRGQSYSLQRDADGHIKLEIRSRGEDGKLKTETYEADSLEEFEEQYPELMKRHGIRFDGGSMRIGPGPRWRIPGLGFPTPLLPRSPFPHGVPRRLGVMVESVDDEQAAKLDAPGALIVREVEPRSLAGRLGVKTGDVLLALNGTPIKGTETVREVLAKLRRGEVVTLKVAREGKGTLELRTSIPAGRKKRRSI